MIGMGDVFCCYQQPHSTLHSQHPHYHHVRTWILRFLVSVGLCTSSSANTSKLYAISVGTVQSQYSTFPSVCGNYDDSTYVGLLFWNGTPNLESTDSISQHESFHRILVSMQSVIHTKNSKDRVVAQNMNGWRHMHHRVLNVLIYFWVIAEVTLCADAERSLLFFW